jgi:hypothetical protein
MERPQRIFEQAALYKWVQSLYYRQIRGSESLLPGVTDKGKRIRGLTLAFNFYLARDKQFYEVTDGVAKIIDPQRVCEMYALETLKKLYQNALIHPVGA